MSRFHAATARLTRTAAKAAGIAVLAGAATLMVGVPAASAHPNTPHPVPGVTIENLWLHCNAAGGRTDETPTFAICWLPGGGTVECTPAGCVMYGIQSIPTSPNRPTKVNLPTRVTQLTTSAPVGPIKASTPTAGSKAGTSAPTRSR
jgi:hypothetical protein